MIEVVQVERVSKEIESIYIREFGHLICNHWMYLPDGCEKCLEHEHIEMLKLLNSK